MNVTLSTSCKALPYLTLLRFGRRGKVQRLHAARMLLAIAVQRLGYGVAVYFTDAKQRSIRILGLIQASVYIFLQIVLSSKKRNLNGFSNAIIRTGVALRGFMRRGIHFSAKVVEKRKECDEK